MVEVAEVSELEDLGKLIMDASVRAQFLGYQRIVDTLDVAFSDVVRAAMEMKTLRVAAEMREAALAEGGAEGGS